MAAKKKLWVTYAWKDNEEQDVDYVLEKLEESGLEVHFDRRQLQAGVRIWDQIEREIADPQKCDAYAIIVTPASLASQACQEELAYALDRALSARGSAFPLIPLIHKIKPHDLIPRLKIRLGILLDGSDWVAQVVAAVHGRPAGVDFGAVGEFKLRVWTTPPGEKAVFVLEIGTRVESIPRWKACVPLAEKDRLVGNAVRFANDPFGASIMLMHEEGYFADSPFGPLHYVGADNPIDHANSLYLYLRSLPTRLFIVRRDGRGTEIDLSSVRGRVP